MTIYSLDVLLFLFGTSLLLLTSKFQEGDAHLLSGRDSSGQMQTHVYKPGLKEPTPHREQRAERWTPLSEGFLMQVKALHIPISTGNKYPY